MLAEVFRRVGYGSRTFVEIGVEDGTETNTTALLLTGWRGLWIEAQAASVAAIRAGPLAAKIEADHLRVENVMITQANADELLRSRCFDPEPALVSIDVDGNDYWIWEAIESVHPRVVVIEYNATWHPPMSLTISYQESFRWKGTNYFGASLTALERLGAQKGYSLVGCCFAGVNAVFVRNDLCRARFRKPYTAENHYEPPRFFMVRPSGHAKGLGPVELIE